MSCCGEADLESIEKFLEEVDDDFLSHIDSEDDGGRSDGCVDDDDPGGDSPDADVGDDDSDIPRHGRFGKRDKGGRTLVSLLSDNSRSVRLAARSLESATQALIAAGEKERSTVKLFLSILLALILCSLLTLVLGLVDSRFSPEAKNGIIYCENCFGATFGATFGCV